MTAPDAQIRSDRLRTRTDLWVRRVLAAFAAVAGSAVVLTVLLLAYQGLPVLGTEAAATLGSPRWIPVSFKGEQFGLLPLLTGSVLVTALAGLLAVPVGVGGAVYLSEFAAGWERPVLRTFIEALAGLPSVVLGFFGLVVVGPAVKELLGLSSGLTALTGALVLGFMAVPTILAVSADALQAVPSVQREASLALGATRWQTAWRVVAPAATRGLAAAVMLGLGRVVGETMVVLMVTGNAPQVTANPLESVRTMTATIAAEMGEAAVGSEHYRALFLVGLVLLGITLAFNIAARRLVTNR